MLFSHTAPRFSCQYTLHAGSCRRLCSATTSATQNWPWENQYAAGWLQMRLLFYFNEATKERLWPAPSWTAPSKVAIERAWKQRGDTVSCTHTLSKWLICFSGSGLAQVRYYASWQDVVDVKLLSIKWLVLISVAHFGEFENKKRSSFVSLLERRCCSSVRAVYRKQFEIFLKVLPSCVAAGESSNR